MSYDNLRRLGGCKPLTPQDRFWRSFVQVPIAGCWIWLGSPQGSNGYGRLKVDGRGVAAHRYSFQIHYGEVPAGKFVCHRCDVPLCVNPHHLFAGSEQDNTADKVAKGRQARGRKLSEAQSARRAKGERNGNSRLTAEQVFEIRQSQRAQRAIAAQYGITQAAVSAIKRGKVWK